MTEEREEQEDSAGLTRRPDPTLGRRLSSRPQLPPIRPDGVRGMHRRREEKRDDRHDEVAEPPAPARERVVLADPRQRAFAMRPRVELEQSSTWGTGMVGDLARQQLRCALVVAAVVVLLLGALPLAYFFSPTFAGVSVIGVPLAWLLLGVAPFPLMFVAGLWFNHMADRHEREFVKMFDG